jgi:hypothetical protein
LHEENDIFDKNAALRMDEAIKASRTTLIEAPNGWIAGYYPEKKYAIGGYAMYWKFLEDGTMDIACELAVNSVPAITVKNSLWDIKPDQGPVLSVDLYNPVMHYFCQPSNSDLDGLGGDYEFVIMKISEDKNTIEMKGKKNNNRLFLKKADANPLDYLEQVNTFATAMSALKTFDLHIDGKKTGSANFSSDVIANTLPNRTISVSYTIGEKDTSYTVPYIFIPDGVLLNESIEIDNNSVSKFSWDKVANKFTSGNIELIFFGKLPVTEDNITTYVPDPDFDAVNNFKNLKNSSSTTTRVRIIAMSSKLDAWRIAYQTAFPAFSFYSLSMPRSTYDMSFAVNYTPSGIWYWGPETGKIGWNPMTEEGHNPKYEVYFSLGRSSTSSPPAGYNTAPANEGAASFRAFLQQAEGFTVFQSGNNFYFRSNKDPNDWFKFEPY